MFYFFVFQQEGKGLVWNRLSDHEKAFAYMFIFALFAIIAAYSLSPDISR